MSLLNSSNLPRNVI